jgi:hypothetical protein
MRRPSVCVPASHPPPALMRPQDRSGFVSTDEFVEVLTQEGVPVDEAIEIFRHVDRDKVGLAPASRLAVSGCPWPASTSWRRGNERAKGHCGGIA